MESGVEAASVADGVAGAVATPDRRLLGVAVGAARLGVDSRSAVDEMATFRRVGVGSPSLGRVVAVVIVVVNR